MLIYKHLSALDPTKKTRVLQLTKIINSSKYLFLLK